MNRYPSRNEAIDILEEIYNTGEYSVEDENALLDIIECLRLDKEGYHIWGADRKKVELYILNEQKYLNELDAEFRQKYFSYAPSLHEKIEMKENKTVNEEEEDASDEENDSDSEELITTDYRTIFIRGKNTCADSGHETKAVRVIVDVFWGKEVHPINVPAFFCEDCQIYFIEEKVYQDLSNRGRIMRQVMTLNQYYDFKSNNKFDNYSPKSILNILGYNVNKQEDLSESERHIILDYIISSGALSRKNTIQYLEYFIRRSEKQKNMAEARRKWNDDLMYLRGTDNREIHASRFVK